jgi:DNA-binding IscR family transcriptional regulator
VIEAIEGDSRRTSCVLRGGPCGSDGNCRVHDVFFAAQDALITRPARRDARRYIVARRHAQDRIRITTPDKRRADPQQA